MTDEDILVLLQTDIGYVSVDESRRAQLMQLISAAVAFIRREGLPVAAPYSIEHAQLVEMYAAYLFRKRDTTEAMPRMLRWALNNALLSKAGGGTDVAE